MRTKWILMNSHYYACVLILCFTSLSLVACATLNKNDCLQGDWAGVGYKDGAAGYESSTRLARHNKACTKHNVTPNAEVYLQNHARGLTVFCTKANGYQFALDEREYTGNCPKDLHGEFVEGYLSGLDVALERVQEQINKLNSDKQNRESQLVVLQSKLIPDANTIENVQSEIESLDDQINYESLKRTNLRERIDKWTYN